MILMILVGIVSLLIGCGFGWFLLKRNKGLASHFIQGLGFYETVASFVGIGMGFYLISVVKLSPAARIILLVIFLALGVLGIVAGRLLISGKSDKSSFCWGFAQLPVISLNLHWIGFAYHAGFLLWIPIFFIFRVVEKIHFLFNFGFKFGVYINLDIYFQFPGEGFEIGLGINLAAASFLLLLLISRNHRLTSESKS